MALRKAVERLRKPIEQLDREQLQAYCADLDVTRIKDVTPRSPVRVAGEVRSVRIVPRAGAPAVEASVSDGDSSVTAVFLGRRKIAGLSPGRRLLLDGVVAVDGKGLLMYNPRYQLLS
jgi:hypothetical protein